MNSIRLHNGSNEILSLSTKIVKTVITVISELIIIGN
jgi:hypothetical protein